MNKIMLTKDELKRRTLSTILDTDIEEQLEGKLCDVLQTISGWMLDYGDYDYVRIDSEYYGDYTSWRLVGYRKENDEEYNTRLEKLRARKRKIIFEQEAAERKLFKELLEKYGGPDTENRPTKEELGLV